MIATIIPLAHAIFDPRGLDLALRRHHPAAYGWTPEFGFLASKWDYYSELMMIYLLGMGSSRHPLRPEAWLAWKRTHLRV